MCIGGSNGEKEAEPFVGAVRSQNTVVAQVAHIYDSDKASKQATTEGDKQHVEPFQFWSKLKGRRIRVWPSELTIRVCSESGKKWVTSAEGRGRRVGGRSPGKSTSRSAKGDTAHPRPAD